MNLSNPASWVANRLNFFRIHVLFFTFMPLIFSAVFYAANGATHVPYIDALFSCVSAITSCGLITVDLSSLTGFQQALLFVQSAIGNLVVVSWVVVYIRRRYFNKRLQYIIEAEITKRRECDERRVQEEGERDKFLRGITPALPIHPSTNVSGRTADGLERRNENEKYPTRPGLITPKVIRRTSDAPRRVDPSGLITDPVPVSNRAPDSSASSSASQTITTQNDMLSTNVGATLEKTQAVEFYDPAQIREDIARASHNSLAGASDDGNVGLRVESPSEPLSYKLTTDNVHNDRTYIPPGGVPLRRRTSTFHPQTVRISRDGSIAQEETVYLHPEAKNRDFGGFPYPTTLLYLLLKGAFPMVRRVFEPPMTLLKGKMRSMLSRPKKRESEEGRNRGTIKYFSNSFNALSGRNSMFYDLTEEDLEELGGVEYRALNALLWLIATYHSLTQLLCFTIIAPYISLPRWAPVFEPPNLHRQINPVWYSAFQVVGAYTTSGMSLVDQSMVPFQRAYPLIFVCTFLILAGNLAFPVFLRFFIWSILKLSPRTHLNETLQFLLDHPRRCYIYLFPSPHTWFLLGVVLSLIVVDWFFFLILNIGEEVYEAIPLGVRFAIGLLQSTSVRAAGFATVSTSSFAPALQVLYVLVMYLGIYPIALSVRATNVYEEKSLGVYEGKEDDDCAEPEVEQPKLESYGKFVVWHARRQLSFDMWWLGLALFLLCIIERSKIRNQDNFEWFTIFTLIFDITSAYAGVGMSLGVPYANFSFSGALTPLSKFIMIIVMLRGRHRGLPVAIDRAVMLPFEYKKVTRTDFTEGQNGERGPREADEGESR